MLNEARDRRLEAALGDATGAQVLVRSLRLLFHIREAGPVSVAELVETLDTPKSNVYRLIQTLEIAGLVTRSPSGGVMLGLRFLDLAQAPTARIQHEISPAALPIMRRLTEQVRETSLLTMPTGIFATCVLSVESPHPVRVSYTIGRVMPMDAGASGKVLLPWLPARLLEATLRDAGSNAERLREEIASIRQRGYCLTRGELDVGLTGLAAPVLVDGQRLVGGLTLVGPTERFADERLAGLVGNLREATTRIARRLRQDGG